MPTTGEETTVEPKTMKTILETLTTLLQNQQEIMNKMTASDTQSEKINEIASQLEKFEFDSTSEADFSSWYARYESLLTIDGCKLEDKVKTSIIVRKLGVNEHHVFVNFIKPKKPEELNLAETVRTLKKLFSKNVSLFKIRCNLMEIEKLSTESYAQYTARVKDMCEAFQFSSLTFEQFECLMFIAGLRKSTESDVKTRLLTLLETKADEIKLHMFYDEVSKLINLKKDATSQPSTSSGSVAVKKIKHKKGKKWNSNTKDKNSNADNFKDKNSSKKQKDPQYPCFKCGQMHHVYDCSYNDHVCKNCQRKGHKEGYCGCIRNKKDDSSKVIRSIQINVVSTSRKYVDVKMQNSIVKLQVDTASDVTVIGKAIWKQIGRPTLERVNVVATDANGNSIDIIGCFNTDIIINGAKGSANIMVTKKSIQLLGLDVLNAFNLFDVPLNSICINSVNQKTSSEKVPDLEALKRELREHCPEAFKPGLGKCTKKLSLRVIPGSKPVYVPPRPVAYAMRGRVEEELNRLEEQGVITKVKYSQWAAPIVVVKKQNGKLRICADYSTGLNAVLEPNNYPQPTSDDAYAKLGPKEFYSKFDLTDAYFQGDLDDQSREYLTINTHVGLFRMNRLSQGAKSAPGEFQQLMETIFSDMLENVVISQDDIAIADNSVSHHVSKIKKVIDRLNQYGFRVNLEKCKFFQREIKFLGNIISKKGLTPDPEKIKAIQQMPPPKDVSQLRSLLGSMNFYQKFVKNMTVLRAPLDALLQKDAEFVWSKECQEVLDNFKNQIVNFNLCHYQTDLPLILASDASNYGIGSCILHKFPDGNMRPIQFASRTLSPAEKNYSQIEKEALAIIFGLGKFHKFIYGRKFILQTDHKPLLSIYGSKKGISAHSSSRLLRWGLKLSNYDYSIEYINTNDFGYADVLSRLIPKNTSEEDVIIASIRSKAEIAVISSSIEEIPIRFQEIKEDTLNDPILKQAKNYVKSSWPSRVNDQDLVELRKRSDELSIVDEVLMFEDRVVVPYTLRETVLNQIHRHHAGISATKSLARSYVYWPNMDRDIEHKVKNCHECIRVSNAPTKHLLHSWPKSIHPWQRIHADYAEKDGINYLVIVDSFSKYPEIYPTTSTNSKTTIDFFSDAFARHGIPQTLVTDNGPQFRSHEIESYLRRAGIQHLTIAPYHPSSNGQAERMVQTFKRALQKMNKTPSKIALNQFLINYRSTPNPNCPGGVSPAEAIFKRKLRTTLNNLLPSPPVPTQRDTRMEEKYNKKHGAKERKFSVNEAVRYRSIHQKSAKWQLGTVIEIVGNSMYNVWLTESEKLVRAHADQLLPGINQTEANYQIPFDLLTSELLSTEFNLPHQEIQPPENLNISDNVSESSATSVEIIDLLDSSTSFRSAGSETPEIAYLDTPVPLVHHQRTIRIPLSDCFDDLTEEEKDEYLFGAYRESPNHYSEQQSETE